MNISSNQAFKHKQITAGAGSGKTQRISEIIAESIESGTPPKGIVAITYGIQASQELKGRILLTVNKNLGPITGLSQMTVGTIHSVCLRLLKTFLPKFSSYRLLSEAQIYLLVQEHFHELEVERIRLVDGSHAGDTLEKTIWDLRAFLDVLSVLREAEVDWRQVPKMLHQSCKRYKELMQRERALDYTGLLHETVKALSKTGDDDCLRLRRHIEDNVREIYVDEYQDCNPIQEKLIRLFAELGVRVTVVGDANQSIYGWRGCVDEYVTSFAARYGAQAETLENNYRSAPGILGIARQLLGEQAGEAMRPAGHQITEQNDLVAGNFATPAEEADFIAARIQRLIGTPFQDAPDSPARGLSYSDIAILCRSVRQSAAPIIAALEAAGIPYLVSGLGGLFSAPEVRAVMRSFLLMAGIPEIIRANGKLTGRRPIFAVDVVQAWRDANLGFTEADIESGVAYLLEQKDLYAEKPQSRDEPGGKAPALCNLQLVYQDLMGRLGLREEKTPPSNAGAARGMLVMSNLGALSQAIDEFEALRYRQPAAEKLVGFADWLQQDAPQFFEDAGEAGGTGEGTIRLAEPDAVTVCTIHRAKGKEWAAVFVPNLVEGRFPHDGQSRGRTKWHILPRRAVRDTARYDTTLAEETRLAYVAMTRAKKFLHLTFAPDPTYSRPQKMSRFLDTFARHSDTVKINTPALAAPPSSELRLPPQPRLRRRALVLTFSQISTFLRCSYLFKLRILFGWAAPPGEAEGFGKGEHDALAEVHSRAIAGLPPIVDVTALAQELTARHLLLPYSSKEAYAVLAQAAVSDLTAYLATQQACIRSTIHAEMPYEITLSDGLTITGRNDIVYSKGDDETLREIKSRKEAQSKEITRVQLYLEDLGYFAATGRHASHLEVYNMSGGADSEAAVQFREAFDPAHSETVKASLQEAGRAIRRHDLPRLAVYDKTCQNCDHAGLCRDAPPSPIGKHVSP